MRYIVRDDHAGLKQAREARFTGVPFSKARKESSIVWRSVVSLWQSCPCHLAQNALPYLPGVAMRSEVARDLRRVLGHLWPRVAVA